MAAFASSLVAGSFGASASAAAAQSRIEIAAGPLIDSLRSLSAQTGVSVGFAGRLPDVVARRVHGARDAATALRQMLAGTGYRAVATGGSSFRIEAVVTSDRRHPRSPPPPPQIPDEREIVVTALKRPTTISAVPGTINVVSGRDWTPASGIAGSDDLNREIPSLSATDVGAGRNRLFLRGIGDGPLGGYGQGSVAVLMDEARLTYDAPDPDWALVDIDRVEVLEGPQGPLYGTGAIGGIVKIVTRHPDAGAFGASVSAGLSTTQDGDLSNDQSLALNLPLGHGAAVRAVAYRSDEAGWINTSGGRNDSNRTLLSGGRFGLRLAPGRWTVDVTVADQSRRAADSQYVDRTADPLRRTNRLREQRDLDAKLAMVTLVGPVGPFELTSVTSLTGQETVADYDATPLAPALGLTGVVSARDDRRYTLFDQEVRLRDPRSSRFDWVAGASLIEASTHATTKATDDIRTLDLLSFRRAVTEAAVFGEANVTVSPRWTFSGGARLFANRFEDEGRTEATDRIVGKTQMRAAGSAAVSWKAAPKTTVFARVATAFRPGGVNAQSDASQDTYRADKLASAELGIRSARGPLSLESTLFVQRWTGVQTEELLANGLVATRNAGDALNFGVEGRLRWSTGRSTSFDLGFLVQSAKLENSPGSVGIDDRRLPAVPQLAIRGKLLRRFTVGRWQGRMRAGLDYVGAAHLSFDPVLDRRTRGHVTFDAGVTLSKRQWTFELAGENLANSTADTFAFGNPFRIMFEDERTPVRPRTIGLIIRKSFR